MKDIKTLLQRYYEGDTTLEEEAYLKQYLAAHPDAADPASAALMTDLQYTIAPAAKERPSKRIRLSHGIWATTALAAAVTVLLWLRGGPEVPLPDPAYTLSDRLLADPAAEGEILDEQLALEQARKALSYVSAQLNKGAQGLRNLDRLDQSLSKIQKESL